MSQLEEIKNDWLRKGEVERVDFLNNLHKKLLQSQIKQIQQNDKNVLKEIVVPNWLSWDLLYLWSTQWHVGEGRRCITCGETNQLGIDFKEKWICDNCFMRIKNL